MIEFRTLGRSIILSFNEYFLRPTTMEPISYKDEMLVKYDICSPNSVSIVDKTVYQTITQPLKK